MPGPTLPKTFMFLALAPAMLLACDPAGGALPDEPATVSITSPAPGELVTSKVVRIRGTATNTDEVEVEGKPASVVGGVWDAEVQLPEGEATVEVNYRGVKDSVTFTVDASAPKLEMIQPARAAFIPAEQNRVTVSGVATDGLTGVSFLQINDQQLEASADGSFTYELTLEPGYNQIEITAQDKAGNTEQQTIGVIHGDFVDPLSPVDPGFDITFPKDTFPKVAALVQSLITPESVSSLIQERLMLDGVELKSIAFAPLEITATPRSNQREPSKPGYIDFELVIRDVEVVGEVMLSDEPIGLTVEVAEATIATTVTLSADGEGSLDIELGEAELDLPEDALSWEVATGGSELTEEDVGFLANTVEEIVRRAFSELLSERVFEQLYDPQFLERRVELLGRVIEFKVKVEEVITNASGVFARTTLEMPAAQFSEIPEVPGALAWPTGITSVPMLEADMMATLDQRAANRLTHGLWRSGLFNQTLAGDDFAGFDLPIELQAGALALVLDGRVTNHADSTSPAGLKMRPQLPPVVEIKPDEGTTGLVAQLGELHIDVLLDVDKTPKKLVTLAAFIELGINLEIEDAKIALSFDVKGSADIVDEPLFDLDNNTAEDLFNGVFELIPQVLSRALVLRGEADLTLFKISNPRVEIHGLDRDQISVGLDLITPTEE